jgi:predicted metal-dependent peptidase
MSEQNQIEITTQDIDKIFGNIEEVIIKKQQQFANVNLDFALIDLIVENPFFAGLSRFIRKSQDFSIPTIGVGFDEHKDEFVMWFNPEFISTLTKKQLSNILVHEFYHIVFEHISTRKKKPHIIWNIATDLAINSIILNNSRRYYNNEDSVTEFPEGAFVPGEDFSKFNPKSSSKDIEFFSSLKIMENSEYYFDHLLEHYKDKMDQNQQGSGKSGESNGENSGIPNGFDSHEKWDEESTANKQLIKQKLGKILEKAAQEAHEKGWGNIPQIVRDQINQVIASQSQINWKDILRNFINNVSSSSRRTSLKRINRKYPYTHPGTIKNRVPKLLVAIDESGSISNENIAMFFNELSNLTKLVSIDVLPFDCDTSEEFLINWKKGQKITPVRRFSGGTDFDAPTKVANAEENRGKWDALIIFTDGVASKPRESRVKRAWIIIPGYSLNFQTNELIINMTNEIK